MKKVINRKIIILLSLLLFLTLFSGCFLFPPTNQAPTITSTQITTATVDELYTYDVDATDLDGDTLTYSLTTNPSGMTINSTTGVISWTPNSGQIGYNNVAVEVSDGGLSDNQSFVIEVIEAEGPGYTPTPGINHAPTITSIPITTVTVDDLYVYGVNATDPDGDTLTYSLTTKPTGMTINSSTGLINWTPTSTGDYDVTVRVSDGSLFDTQSFTIHVSEGAVPTSEEIEFKEVVSKTIDLEIGGVIEVTDESSEIYGTRLIINPSNKVKKSKDKSIISVSILLASAFMNPIVDYQGFLITPITVNSNLIHYITGTLEIKYNEDKLSNSGVGKDDKVNVYRLKTTGGNILATGIYAIPLPVHDASWEKVSEDKYSDENNIVKISIDFGDLGYYYTLTVTNCEPPSDLGNPLPGDLVYRLSVRGPNDNWLPGHVGIYVGEKYHEVDGKYNVIEALPLKVVRGHYDPITSFNLNGQASYMGAREPINQSLTHTNRNIIVDYVEAMVGMPYAIIETFGVYFGLARGGYVKGTDLLGSFNCVGLAEKAYEVALNGLVSDYDEGNLSALLNPDAILSPQEQLFRTAPATGIIDQNIPPEISNLEVIPEGFIEPNSLVFITCNANDQDQDILTYIWTIPEYGNFITFTKGKSISWGTPNEEGRYEISCKVIDNYGGEDKKSVKISVGDIRGQISGSVKDAVIQSPLQGVLVEVYDGNSLISSGTTDSSGVYSISVPAGSGYKVEFTKSGYIPAIYYDVSVVADVTTYLETVLQIDDNYSGEGNISGTISNALTGEGVSGLTIKLREGINVTSGTVIASTTTETEGYYSVTNLNAGYYTAEVSGTGYNTTYFTVICIGGTTTDNQNANITPVLLPGEIRIILTWGAIPPDIDSHLTGPLPGGTRFHMYYPDAEANYGSPWPEYVKLDRDDVDSYGPETTTIYQQIPGVYRFSVHDYTNRGSSYSTALSNSGAQVRVYRGNNLIATFNVPANQEGTLWTVFEMDGDTITPINTMSYESNPSDVRNVRKSIAPDAELMKNLPPKR